LHQQAAHPLLAGALTAILITGIGLDALRGIRPIDINTQATILKTHGHTPGTHRQCRVHHIPPWGTPLLAAARAFHHLSRDEPGNAVFSTISFRDAADLRETARHCRLLLNFHPRPSRPGRHRRPQHNPPPVPTTPPDLAFPEPRIPGHHQTDPKNRQK
jgi:hypothetical protein